MRAATHQTIDFLPAFIYGLTFIGAIGFYARERGVFAAPLSSPPVPAQLLSK